MLNKWFEAGRRAIVWWSVSCLPYQYKTCKDGSVLGVTVTRIALLTHCQALTQSCSYTEGILSLTHTHRHKHTLVYPGSDPFLLLSCSWNHSERLGLQEGRGALARHPDGETFAFGLETLRLLCSCSVTRRDVNCVSAERDEHDARHQRAVLPDEGQPSVLDPESVPVQRSASASVSQPDTHIKC